MTFAPAGGTTGRLPRLLALVPWLRTHPDSALADAALTFGVTERQLSADIQLLFLCGLPGGSPGDLIDIAVEGDRITLLDPQVLDRPLRLSADEGAALLVAVRALSDVPGLTERDALDRVRRKLELAVGATSAPAVTEVPPAVAVSIEAVDNDALAAMRRGVAEGRRLHLRYLGAAREDLTERDVDPIRLVLREGRLYLEGWCHRAEAMRLFRTDRVQEATVLNHPSTPPVDAVPRDLAEGLFHPAPTQQLVELLLRPGAGWVAEYYPCEYVREAPGGDLHVGLRTPDPIWVRALVLRLGGRAVVVAPASLAQDVIDLAYAGLAAYGASGG